MCILLLPERQLPVPLDEGNEGSEDKITKAVGDQTHRARTKSNGCVVRAYDLSVTIHKVCQSSRLAFCLLSFSSLHKLRRLSISKRG